MKIFYAFLVIFKFLVLPSDDQSEIALHPFLSFCIQSNRLSSMTTRHLGFQLRFQFKFFRIFQNFRAGLFKILMNWIFMIM